jgi:citrate lyase subunit beta/citryl-CoA lyase
MSIRNQQRQARRRSFLFTPGNSAPRLKKVFAVGADCAILDLEDAVATSEKVAARATVVAALQQPRSCPAYVRVNGLQTSWCYGDLLAVVGQQLDGIVLPKAESGSQLQTLDWILSQLETERGLVAGSLDLLPLVETARGVNALEELCTATRRVKRFAFGGVDYARDLDLRVGADEAEFAHVRARLTHCSRGAGLEPPIDTVSTQIRDPDSFAAAARRARGMGFQGKLCIHPSQVEWANRIFTPTAEEVLHARAIIQAFEAAQAEGNASIEVDGLFVDYPVAEQARRIVAAGIDG